MRALRNFSLILFAVVAIETSFAAAAAPAGARPMPRVDCWDGVGIYSDPVFSSEPSAQATGESLDCNWVCYAAHCDSEGIYYLGPGCDSFCNGEGYPANVDTYEVGGMYGFVTGLCYCHDLPEGR